MTRRYEDFIFNTRISVSGLARPAEALSWLSQLQASLSRFDDRSDVAKLNRLREADVSPLLIEVLLASLEWAQHTSGLVTPLLGRELVRAGYDHSFESLSTGGGQPDDSGAIIGPETDQELVVDAGRKRVRLPEGIDLDLGGFVKGWAADTIARQDGSDTGLVNLGGDIRAWSGGKPWSVSTEDMAAPPVVIADGAVATSSIRVRNWYFAGERRHHIIDPRTSKPSTSDCAEATIVAGTALSAEVAAKYAVLVGIEVATYRLPSLFPGCTWSLLDRNDRRHTSPDFPTPSPDQRHHPWEAA